MIHRRLGAVVAVAGTAVSLAACMGGGSGDPGPSPGGGTGGTATGTARSPGPTPYLPVPDGVVLTDEGSELGLGESAVVAWRPRQGEVGVLRITVRTLVHADSRDLQQWQLDAAGRRSSVYYVTVAVKNDGDQDLGGDEIPLYVLDDADTLVQASSFATRFEPCPSDPLPDVFEPGDTTTGCLAYLVPRHGTLEAVSFRPTQGFNPITWVGKVTEATKGPTKGPSKKPSKKPAGQG